MKILCDCCAKGTFQTWEIYGGKKTVTILCRDCFYAKSKAGTICFCTWDHYEFRKPEDNCSCHGNQYWRIQPTFDLVYKAIKFN